MTVSPHPNDNTPMTKRMRDPNPQALIKFDEPPPRIIYEKLVNPTAMKLFSQARVIVAENLTDVNRARRSSRQHAQSSGRRVLYISDMFPMPLFGNSGAVMFGRLLPRARLNWKQPRIGTFSKGSMIAWQENSFNR